MQSRKQSLAEAFVNVAIGIAIGLATQVVVLPIYGCEVSLRMNMEMVIIFTVVSFIRTYIVRRGFNLLHRKQNAYKYTITEPGNIRSS